MAGSNRRFTLAAMALPFLFVVTSGLARANEITVTTTSGESELFPLCSLPDAIQAANPPHAAVNGCPGGSGNDEIAFNVTGTINIDESLVVTDPILQIVGPDVGGIKINGEGSVQIFQAQPGTTLTLSDLTLENGFAAPGTAGGGAIYAHGTEVDVDHCLLINNQADGSSSLFGGLGGAIFADAGAVAIVNSTLTLNITSHCSGVGV